ncbi:glycosyltransferase [Candidatus Saccharibacteria bacterium]|nr:glycosyltransferase [Candidatus Saccharibacteria bacterium]
MRIAFFTDVFLEVPGGIPSSIKAQKAALESLGHHVTIFCPGWEKQQPGISMDKKSRFSLNKNSNEDIIIVPSFKLLRPNGAPLAKSPKKVLQYIEKLYPVFSDSFDLVHVHYEASCSIAGVKLAKKYHLKLVQTMHGREDIAIYTNVPTPLNYLVAQLLNFLHQKSLESIQKRKITLPQKDDYLIKTSVHRNMWELMIRQASLADIVISPSQHFAKNLEHYHAAKTVHVVSNGIDDELLAKYSFKIRERQQNDPLKIIWSSRVSKEKRILPFLESIKQSKYHKNIQLTVIGDGNQLQEAKAFAKANLTDTKIVFLGLVPHEELFQYEKDQHLSIINSYGFDTQGMTILEAIACGLPVIYADPAMDENIPDHCGLRAKNNTPAAMAELLDYIFENPELIKAMSEAALKASPSVMQSAQIKKLLNLYQPISSESHP